MHILTRAVTLLFYVIFAVLSSFAQNNAETLQEKYKQGHSKHGEAYDVGPREKPWAMEGLSITHFPITTKNPEVQKWFGQGFTLLHSFWYFEAREGFDSFLTSPASNLNQMSVEPFQYQLPHRG